jgi:hypothetical protein
VSSILSAGPSRLTRARSSDEPDPLELIEPQELPHAEPQELPQVLAT